MVTQRIIIRRQPVLRTVVGLMDEFLGALRLLEPRIRNGVFFIDMLAYRLIRAKLMKPNEIMRKIFCRPGFTVSYTRNRGDIFTIQEVFCRNLYKVPTPVKPEIFIDLGANIGCTAIDFYNRYRPSLTICVEPVPRNLRLLRQNLSDNAIPAKIAAGVVAEVSGEMRFFGGEANAGYIDERGYAVKAFSMDEILAMTPGNSADVVKMDVEGYEEILLRKNNAWLDRVGCIIVEFHSHLGDRPVHKESLVKLLQDKGFFFIPRETSGTENTFIRPGFHGFAPAMPAASRAAG